MKNLRKIVLITRKTRLENLIVRYNTVSQTQFFIEHTGGDFSDYLDEDTQYKKTVRQMVDTLKAFGSLHLLDRDFVPNFIFGKDDVVVAVGQDGLVANTLKYLDYQPLVGVNPDPRRWDGVLLPFCAADLPKIIPEVLENRRHTNTVTLAQADLNDGQTLYAVNDFFIGQRTHVSARYRLNYAGKEEQQSSSGIIVSTGLGATGWLKSILAGASGVVNGYYDEQVSLRQQENFRRGSDFLYYTVREPFPSKWTSAGLVFGKIDKDHPFTVSSQMPEGGVIFSDGIESDFLEFTSGIAATIRVADKKGLLVV